MLNKGPEISEIISDKSICTRTVEDKTLSGRVLWKRFDVERMWNECGINVKVIGNDVQEGAQYDLSLNLGTNSSHYNQFKSISSF